ncbi:MAG: PAS domain-containing protein, partial [Bacteroidales bacterium]|nr:PAS domain-containing protein [Bacteroidales bacterium]
MNGTIHGDGCISVTGYSSDEFYKDHDLWYKIVHPEDKQLVIDKVEEILKKKEVLSFEHRIIHKNGTMRWIMNTPVLRIDESGELTGYEGLIQNITDRKLAEKALKESEEKFRLLFYNMSNGFILYELVFDEDQKVS